MKRFFPSSMMLTPFLVKYYRHQEEYCPETSNHESPQQSDPSECDPNAIVEQD